MPVAVARAQAPYFERRAPFALLVASFALVFLPLTALSLVPNFYTWVAYLIVLEAVGLGVTHFFITLALYLQSSNLDYFASSTRNRLVYFVVPVLILIGLATIAATDARTRYPAVIFWLFAAIRLADFFHVGRQSYGMLQIWKRPAAEKLARWQRPAENAFFIGLSLMQFQSYLLGQRFQSDRMIAVIPALGLGLLFVVLAVTYLRASDQGLGPQALRPLAYLCMQGLCAAVAVYQTRLYVIALVLHYVEYHIIMAPRCFYTPLDPSRRVDRISALLRPRALLFYAALLVVVLLFEARTHLPASMSRGTLFLVHIFDGVFLVHYFIEAFLWRFRVPHYRERVLPLYTRPWSEVSAEAMKATPAPALGAKSSLGIALGLALGLGVAHTQGTLAQAGAYLKRKVADPVYAEQQLEFGLALANQGELVRAREHLRVAIEHSPNSLKARSLLSEVEKHLPRKVAREDERHLPRQVAREDRP